MGTTFSERLKTKKQFSGGGPTYFFVFISFLGGALTKKGPGTDHVISGPMRGLKKLQQMAQTDTHTDGHRNSMTKSAQWGRFIENTCFSLFNAFLAVLSSFLKRGAPPFVSWWKNLPPRWHYLWTASKTPVSGRNLSWLWEESVIVLSAGRQGKNGFCCC